MSKISCEAVGSTKACGFVNGDCTATKGDTMNRLIHVGFGNIVNTDKIIAIVSPESAPIKRIVQDSREIGMLIDATYGRKTKSVLIMDTGHVVLSALLPEAVGVRADSAGEENGGELRG